MLLGYICRYLCARVVVFGVSAIYYYVNITHANIHFSFRSRIDIPIHILEQIEGDRGQPYIHVRIFGYIDVEASKNVNQIQYKCQIYTGNQAERVYIYILLTTRERLFNHYVRAALRNQCKDVADSKATSYSQMTFALLCAKEDQTKHISQNVYCR